MIAAWVYSVEKNVDAFAWEKNCTWVPLTCNHFLFLNWASVNMGNQCLKKIADSDKDGYKQHNQMYVKQDANAFFCFRR